MIEGVVFEFTSDELIKHCQERAEHHEKKSAFHAKRAETAEDEVTDPSMISNKTVQSQKAECLRISMHHQSMAKMYKVYADHIIKGEKYRLTMRDLGELELIKAV